MTSKIGVKIKTVFGKIKKYRVKTWQLMIVIVLMLFADATLMRIDHIRMAEMRDDVLNADAAEDDALVEENLAKLKEFTVSNMVINVVDDNGIQKITFGTGPFYLEHQYIRAANKALAEAEATLSDDTNPNGNIYSLASEACRGQAIANGWAWNNPNYINCMISEIQKYPAADEIQDKVIASLPSTELYRREYASPIWTPTFTGIMVLITVVLVIILLVRIIWWIILRILLLFI